MDLTNDERAALAVLNDTTLAAREAYNAAAAEYERASMAAALVMVRRALAAEAEVTRLRALMAGRTTLPTREEFAALAEMGATLRAVWSNGSDEIPARDAYWDVVVSTPDGSRWWAHGADGALIEWPKVLP